MNSEVIRVLIVDDSPVVRTILASMLMSVPGFNVVGQAQDGEEAVELAARLRPNVITMDIRMPRLNGLEATKRIMRECPAPIVVVASSIYEVDLNIAFNAVAAGALTVVEKPKGLLAADYDSVRDQLVTAVRLVAAVPVITLWSDEHEQSMGVAGALQRQTGLPANVQVIAIGASTGGPGVLNQILTALPSNFNIPIAVVQHITPGFAQGFARWLSGASGRQVSIAQDGDRLMPGRVIVAPDDAHMLITPGGVVRLDRSPAGLGPRPSADRFFESVAQSYRVAAVGIVLTGMSDDGAEGLERLHQAGGYVIAQDASSCVVSAMPDAAVARGVVDQVLAPDAIAAALARIAAGRASANGIAVTK